MYVTWRVNLIILVRITLIMSGEEQLRCSLCNYDQPLATSASDTCLNKTYQPCNTNANQYVWLTLHNLYLQLTGEKVWLPLHRSRDVTSLVMYIIMGLKCSTPCTRIRGQHAQSQNKGSYKLRWYFQVHQEVKEKEIPCGIRITSRAISYSPTSTLCC